MDPARPGAFIFIRPYTLYIPNFPYLYLSRKSFFKYFRLHNKKETEVIRWKNKLQQQAAWLNESST